MKKIKFLALMLLAGTFMFTSCSEDGETVAPPTISFSGAVSQELDFTTVDSIQVVFSATVNAEGEIETFTITEKEVAASGTTSLPFEADKTALLEKETTGIYYFDKWFEEADFAGLTSIQYLFEVTDKDGQSAEKTFTVTKKDVVAGNPINTYSAKLLGGQSNPNAGSFFNSVTGEVLLLAAANANPGSVDFIFAYGTTNQYYIAAPNDNDIAVSHTSVAGWATKNATTFKTTSLTEAEFDAITNDVVIEENTQNTTATKVNNLANGDVFAFVTAEGKKGLVKVVSVEGADAATRAIEIDVKVQE